MKVSEEEKAILKNEKLMHELTRPVIREELINRGSYSDKKE